MTQDNHNELLAEMEAIKRFKESLTSEITATQSGTLDEGDYKKGYERAKSDALLIILGTYAKMFESDSPDQETGTLGYIREVMDGLIPEDAMVGSQFLRRLKTNISERLGTYIWDAYMMGRNEGQSSSEKKIKDLEEQCARLSRELSEARCESRASRTELSEMKSGLTFLANKLCIV